jgi:putative ABC transport system permease protein
MIDIAFKNMWQRKTRTALTVVAIAVCIMLFLVLSTATGTMDQMFADSSGQFAGQMFVKTPSVQAGAALEFPPVSSSLAMEKANALMNVSGIVRPQRAAAVSAPRRRLSSEQAPQVMAVGLPEEKKATTVTRLRQRHRQLTGKDQAVLGPMASTYYKVNVGTDHHPESRLLVAGIADSTGSIV